MGNRTFQIRDKGFWPCHSECTEMAKHIYDTMDIPLVGGDSTIDPQDQLTDNYASDNKEISMMMVGLAILIFIIGFGTLIAGIVGISNIMVYVVKERTKELGIRKALGASPASIVALIMLESVLITALSGYLGLIVGVGILGRCNESV